MNFLFSRWSTCGAAMLAATLAFVSDEVRAHGGGGDIAIFTDVVRQKVDIGFAVLDDDDITQQEFDPNVSVFQAVLIPRTPSIIPPIPYSIGTTEPGFDSEEALPPLKTLRANTRELWYWDGTGDVDFSPAAALGITGGYAPQPDITQADGGYHAHPTFGLSGATIPDGVYLAQVTISVDSLADSDPYYLVTLKDESLYTGDAMLDAENGEMVGEAVRAYLDDPTGGAPVFGGRDYTFYANAVAFARTLPVPEPTSLTLVAMAGAAVAASRAGRRR